MGETMAEAIGIHIGKIEPLRWRKTPIEDNEMVVVLG
jgi:hypothetical protein